MATPKEKKIVAVVALSILSVVLGYGVYVSETLNGEALSWKALLYIVLSPIPVVLYVLLIGVVGRTSSLYHAMRIALLPKKKW